MAAMNTHTTHREPLHKVDDPKEIGRYVGALRMAIRPTDQAKVIEATAVLLRNDHWKSWVDELDGQVRTEHDFRKFVERYLNTTPEALIGALSVTPALRAKVRELANHNEEKR